MEPQPTDPPRTPSKTRISMKLLNESLLASDIIPGAPKRKKLRIRRLVRKQNGDLTLRDTTLLNDSNASLLTEANDSQVSKVDYKFTRDKNADSFRPILDNGQTMGIGSSGKDNFGGFALDPQQMNFVKKTKKKIINTSETFQNENGTNFEDQKGQTHQRDANQRTNTSDKQYLVESEMVHFDYQKNSRKSKHDTPTTNDIKSFTQMIEQDIRLSRKKNQAPKTGPRANPNQTNQSDLRESVNSQNSRRSRDTGFTAVNTNDAMSFQSGFSTQTALFRLPSSANRFQKSKPKLVESAQSKVRSGKHMALERLQDFRDSLVAIIDKRIDSYRVQLENEYDHFLNAYLEDMGQLAGQCEEYSSLPRTDLDPAKPKVRFKGFEFFSKSQGNVLKKERSQIVEYAENVTLVEKKKSLRFAVELLEKRMLHVPGFAETEMARECMQETLAKMGEFCGNELDFLESMVYKAEYVRLGDVGVRVNKETTDIRPSRKSLRRYRGAEPQTQANNNDNPTQTNTRTADQPQVPQDTHSSQPPVTHNQQHTEVHTEQTTITTKSSKQVTNQHLVERAPVTIHQMTQDFELNSENKDTHPSKHEQPISNIRDMQNYESSGGPKERHNIWVETMDKINNMEGERKTSNEDELMKRKEMLNSMQDYEEKVKQFKEKTRTGQDTEQPQHNDTDHNTQNQTDNNATTKTDTPIHQDRPHAAQETEHPQRPSLNPDMSQDRNTVYTLAGSGQKHPPTLTQQQLQILQKNRSKQELYLRKKAEMEFGEAKSTYEQMSVYSLREEEQQVTGCQETAKRNAENMNNMFDLEGKTPDQIEKMMDQNEFRASLGGGQAVQKNDINFDPKLGKGAENTNTKSPNNNADTKNSQNKINTKSDKPQIPKNHNNALPNPNIPKPKPVLNLKFKRSNIDIEKIVKGKKLNGLVQIGEHLFFFGDEFLFKCSLNFKKPAVFKLKHKECTYLESYKFDNKSGDMYLLGVTNKKNGSSEVLLFSLEKKFKLLSRVKVADEERDSVMGIFALNNQPRFLAVTRFGKIRLCAVQIQKQNTGNQNSPMAKNQIILNTNILSTEDLKGEFVESAILAAREASLSVVTQNNVIYSIDIENEPNSQHAIKIQKTRFIQIEEAVNNIIKISEDQLGYCDELGKFSLQTLPCALNNGKLTVRKTNASEFPVDALFLLQSKTDPKFDFRRQVQQILMINYEGRVAVFDFKKRKRQSFFDPKLVEDICYHSQNAILIQKKEGVSEVLILSSKTLRKLVIQQIQPV